MRERHYQAGEMIFSEGEPSEHAFLIRSGRVEILYSAGENPVRLAVLGEQDVFGEMGLLEDRPRAAGALAVTDVQVGMLDRAEYIKMLREDTANSQMLLRALFERLRAMNQRVIEARRGEDQAAKIPLVRLIAASPQASAVLPSDGVVVSRFPFRIGRRPRPEEPPAMAFNEVQLPDVDPHVVSLNHLAIDLGMHGIVVRDRGSRLGSVVNGRRIGGPSNVPHAELSVGDNELIVGPPPSSFGAPGSPYRFRISVARA
jgi:CRP/FNR family transcriptional regulator, cyclic AMP receptor protein